MRAFACLLVFLAAVLRPAGVDAQTRISVVVEVHHGDRPIEQVEVSTGNQIEVTGQNGEAIFQIPPGEVEIRFERYGYASKKVRASVTAPGPIRIQVEMEPESTREDEITVTATRTDKRVEDEPLHVEVIDKEEVDEKTMMTPGDVAMLLNETSGVRVQVTSPSLGAANVRIQGLRGRYTQILADGLPLYGGQTGAIGLLQIPPLDLGQVEVLKGVASALYGASALGGVVNLVSRRPVSAERELLLNQTTRRGTDSVFWLAEPVKDRRWGYSVLGGAHYQKKEDLDSDDWADLPGYRRAVLRPRFYWDDGAGKSLFTTLGAMVEDREGGSMDDRFTEALRSRRFDAGLVGRFSIGNQLLSIRGSAMTQHHRHQFGNVVENDRHQTVFGEAAFSGTKARHTWVVGSAIQADLYRSRDVSRFDYTYVSPGVFVQDDFAVNGRLTVSGSGRMDSHNKYGTFFNPRLSMLLRMEHGFVARASSGTGVFVPTPFTEETDSIGLSRLRPLTSLKPERARSISGDLGWSGQEVEINGSVFASTVRNTLMLTEAPANTLQIVNAAEPTRTIGSEFLVRLRQGNFSEVLTHTFVKSTELSAELARRAEVPLTPRHTAGLTAFWEKEKLARVGLEFFYTGAQRLEDNPYRATSRPYWLFGGLIEKRFGSARLYLNAENLGNVRQTQYDPLLRQRQNFEGKWTVDQWAPLDGRTINGGLRWNF